MARNPERNFPDQETGIILYHKTRTQDNLNKNQYKYQESILLADTRLIEPISSSQNKLIDIDPIFTGSKLWLVSLDIVAGDRDLLLDNTGHFLEEIFLKFNSNLLNQQVIPSNNFRHLKCIKIPINTGLSVQGGNTFGQGMLECIFMEI